MITKLQDDAPDARRQRWLLGTAGVLGLLLLYVWWPGFRQYPAVTSKESLQLMQLLYTAGNTQDPVRLAKVEQGIARLTRDQKLSPPEQAVFRKVVAMAKAGDWKAAEQASFRFAQDQVGVGHPAPPDHHHHPKHPATARAKR